MTLIFSFLLRIVARFWARRGYTVTITEGVRVNPPTQKGQRSWN